MMTFICDYAKVSPAVLGILVQGKAGRFFCNWWDEDEDTFIFRVFTLDGEGLSEAERAIISAVVGPALYIA